MTRPLIIRDRHALLRVGSDFVEISVEGRSAIIGFRHISVIFLYRAVDIGLNDLYILSAHLPIRIINGHGRVIAHFERTTDAQR